MNNYDDRIWVLITKNLSGEATLQEKNELRRWMNEDPDNFAFYQSVKKSWGGESENFSLAEDSSFLFDYKRGLGRLREKIEEEESGHDRKRLQPPVSAQRLSAWKIAASVLLLVFSLSAYVTQNYWIPPETVYTTSQVEQRIVTLPDGSEVRLNRNSKLTFPKNLDGTNREVELEGEAFFEIERNPDRPFLIRANDAVVRVLGTSFVVKEFKNEEENRLMVAVKEGVVSLRDSSAEEIEAVELSAGYLGILPTGKPGVVVEQTDIENYLSWMNGRLVFDGISFEQATSQLERIYGIECELQDPSIGKLNLTVHTERIQKDEVLKAISLALDLTYREQAGKIIWMKNNN